MDGDHTIERSARGDRRALKARLHRAADQRIDSQGNAAEAEHGALGLRGATIRPGVDEVADAPSTPLSPRSGGGAGDRLPLGRPVRRGCDRHLNAMNERGPHPWPLSFSYGRALQAPSLDVWRGLAGERRGCPAGVPPPSQAERRGTGRDVHDGHGGTATTRPEAGLPSASVEAGKPFGDRVQDPDRHLRRRSRSIRNSRSRITSIRTGVVAVTVAERGLSEMSASSPKNSPDPAVASFRPLRRTSASPSRRTKNSRPVSPSRMITLPCARSISSAIEAICSSWRFESPREKRYLRDQLGLRISPV